MTELSICIATFNRATFIAETLDSILSQASNSVEIVIVDGGSTDETLIVLQKYAKEYDNIKYVRESENGGVDRDFDKAVGYATGRYCWLFSDDDLIVPGAIADVLRLLAMEDPDVIIVDAELRDIAMEKTLDRQRLKFKGLRTYSRHDGDRLLVDAGNALSFIGCVIVRRQVWLSRDTEPYFGSLFVHAGVLLQQPLEKVVVIGSPLVIIRMGNSMWTGRSFEIWMFKWPKLIWGFSGFHDSAKAVVVDQYPWRKLKNLLQFRASGAFGHVEYMKHFSRREGVKIRTIARIVTLIPQKLLNSVFLILLTIKGNGRSAGAYNLVYSSKASNSISHFIYRLGGR